MLELIYAIVLPAASSAILFNVGASGGGTDIIAMILKKYTKLNIGAALFLVDLFIVLGIMSGFRCTDRTFFAVRTSREVTCGRQRD